MQTLLAFVSKRTQLKALNYITTSQSYDKYLILIIFLNVAFTYSEIYFKCKEQCRLLKIINLNGGGHTKKLYLFQLHSVACIRS